VSSEERQDRLIEAVSKMAELPDSAKVNIKGKLYAEVHTRVQAFREAYGEDGRIISTIHTADETKVLAETTVSVFVGKAWRVIANDFAEEFRGDGMVNKTSAVENCMTSSIGRALSAAGLSGGNYASFDEVDHAIKGKAEAPQPETAKAKDPPKPAPAPAPAPAPETLAEPTKDIGNFSIGDTEIKDEEGAKKITAFMLTMAEGFSETPEQLKDFYREHKAIVDILDRDFNKQYEVLRQGFSELKNKLLATQQEG
tara:strand:+ start:280 stop:1044 length:765 start_codon:yes stop_codon:yes gene_type:complete